jgi:hypothetical protein
MGLFISYPCELYGLDTIANGEDAPVESPEGFINNDAML